MSLAVTHQHDVRSRSGRPSGTARARTLLAGGALALVLLVATLVANRALWTYGASVAVIAFAAALVINRDVAPTTAQSSQLVVAGARRTASVLAPLADAGWTVMDGARGQRTVVDQLVISPGGPFALVTKTVSGTVRVSRGLVAITPPGASVADFPSDAWTYEARTVAAESFQLLRERTGTSASVRAVVVIWGTFPQRCVSGHNVTFVHGDELAAWLIAQTPQAA